MAAIEGVIVIAAAVCGPATSRAVLQQYKRAVLQPITCVVCTLHVCMFVCMYIVFRYECKNYVGLGLGIRVIRVRVRY
jgi:hypothetical protein